MAINFYTIDIAFKLKDKTRIKSWIDKAITREKRRAGSINFIFCSDDHLLELNKRHLNHDYYTDILTFDYSKMTKKKGNEAKTLSGDIFISITRVEENAKVYKSTFENELYRVLIHGILHLCGYKDKSKAEKLIMRKKEEQSLALL